MIRDRLLSRLEKPSLRLGLGLGLGARGGSGSSGPVAALSLDFLTSETLDARITASGGTNGSRINSAGVIVAATTPRYDYDPVTLAAKGLLVEESRTNLFTSSAIGGAGLITQSVTVTAVPHTISFYGTGTITLSGASTAGPIVGTGDYPTRTSLTFTPTAGALLCTVSGSVRWAQCEAGASPTSFIASAGSPTTRAADVMVMTSTNFSSWFNQTEGTFAVVFDTAALTGMRPLVVNNNTTTERYQVYAATAAGPLLVLVTDNGSPVATLTMGNVAANTTIKVAFGYIVNNFGASKDGSAITTDLSGALPTPDRMHVGGDGTTFLNGHLRSVGYWNTRLSNAQIVALSS